ncbi:MAG: hypothetical protein NVS4B12_00220 [Ktedonobacteraceae bacterium]
MSDRHKGQGEVPSAFLQASTNYNPLKSTFFARSSSFGITPVDIAPAQQVWDQHIGNGQETPFAAPVPPTTPSASQYYKEQEVSAGTYGQQFVANEQAFSAPTQQQDVQTPSNVQEPQAFSSLPRTSKRSTNIGFGLAGLCIFVACLLLLFVYFMEQNLPQPTRSLSSRLVRAPSSVVAQNTPVIDLSPTATIPTASTASPTYPGQQYISNAHTASAVNILTAQPTVLATTFKVGQKIYVTFDVHPSGHIGSICLLWFINGTQFTSYPFALHSTSTTLAYSYAATEFVGSGYTEIYWENAPSCTDPNKLLGDLVDFTVTA